MVKKLLASLLMLMCFLSVSMAQTCRDKNNMKIGSIENNGTVRDAKNMKIGSVESNGTVRDANNMKMGRVEGVNQTYAAVFYFFNLFNH